MDPWHALLKRSVPCCTHQPHSMQRTNGAQVFDSTMQPRCAYITNSHLHVILHSHLRVPSKFRNTDNSTKKIPILYILYPQQVSDQLIEQLTVCVVLLFSGRFYCSLYVFSLLFILRDYH